MAVVARAVRCDLKVKKPVGPRKEAAVPVQVVSVPKVKVGGTESGKILLQPRLCTLRSYGQDPFGVLKTKKDGGDKLTSPFFEMLSEYIESSKKSHDFEIMSGRLAMIVFAATVTTEIMTGNSLFKKLDLQGIEEVFGVCFASVTSAAIFAWLSFARGRVSRMFTISCNIVIDKLIDDIVDGLFYETELSDWSNEL